jgi:propionyl-CoA carboxylase beta chain
LLDEGTFEGWDDVRRAPLHSISAAADNKVGGSVVTLQHDQWPSGCVVRTSRCSAARSRVCRKICKVMDQAIKVGAPVVGTDVGQRAHSGRRRIALGGYADVFQHNVASSVVPQIQHDHGPCAGCRVFTCTMTDFAGQDSSMFVTGPEVVKTGTHEDISAEELGGATTHAPPRAGVADQLTAMSRRSSCCAGSITCRSTAEADPLAPIRPGVNLNPLLGASANMPYDMGKTHSQDGG